MTGRAVVIGSPVAQSLSPAIHRVGFAELGRDWTYDALEVPPESLGDFVNEMRRGAYDAASVTMPLKERIVDLLDDLTPEARVLGAVNCVVRRGETLEGANTDGDGCCDALEAEASFVMEGASVLLLGAGGTARSVALACARRGARVAVLNRTRDRADALVASVGSHPGCPSGAVRAVGESDAASMAVDAIINTTSVGMGSQETPWNAANVRPGVVVLDAVYSPLETRLLREAASAGATCVDGLWMLIHQARRQQMIWFGEAASATTMRAESLRVLAERAK